MLVLGGFECLCFFLFFGFGNSRESFFFVFGRFLLEEEFSGFFFCARLGIYACLVSLVVGLLEYLACV